PAPLVLHPAVVSGLELDLAVGVEDTAPGVQNLEADPAHVRVEVDPGGTRRGGPGGDEVVGVAEGEGAVARAHEGLGGGRGAFAAMQWTAAAVVGRGRTARTRPRGAHSSSLRIESRFRSTTCQACSCSWLACSVRNPAWVSRVCVPDPVGVSS